MFISSSNLNRNCDAVPISNLSKEIISIVRILDSYEVMDEKLTRAPSLRQLHVKHQLKGIFKASANMTIEYSPSMVKMVHLHSA